MQRITRLSASLALALGIALESGAGELKPFQVTYSVDWHGFTAGVSTLTLASNGPGLWTYRSSSEARGLFRAVLGGEITQRSDMRLTVDGIQPLHYVGDDGKASTERDIDLEFDWQRLRVSGTAGGRPVDAPIKPGTQDDLSVQIALIHELDNGRTPTSFQTYGDGGAREYKYLRDGAETLQTPLGVIATVIFRTERSGSPRVTRYWCAPSLGYLPLRAQQKRNDDVEWTMDVRTLKRE